MAQRTNPSDYSWINVGARFTGAHAKLVHQAAAKASVTAAEYMRRILLTQVSKDLGLPAPDMSPYASDNVVSAAAARMGMTPREFMIHAARQVAGQMVPPAATSGTSGTRRKAG